MNQISHLYIIIYYIQLKLTNSDYNLIDTTPSCYDKELCTAYGAPGSLNSIHPNSEERAHYVLRNLARLYVMIILTQNMVNIYLIYGVIRVHIMMKVIVVYQHHVQCIGRIM